MAVLDEEKQSENIGDEHMRRITGIGKAEETAMEHRAAGGADTDTADKRSLDNEELSKAEESATSEGNANEVEDSEESKSLTEHENLIGGGYNADDSTGRVAKFRERVSAISTTKKAAGGGIIGLIIGLVFSISTITSGPFQFVHIAQLLQRFHFSTIEDNSNDRLMKMYKFGRYVSNLKSGTIENTRLGIVGNRVAQSLDAKLADIGITKTYGGTFTAPYTGAEVDALKLSKTDAGEGLRGLGPEEAQTWLQEKFGGTVNINYDIINDTKVPNGTFTIEPDSGLFSYGANRSINKKLLAVADVDGVAGAFATRIMGKRDGITWHPIKTLDNNITGAIDEQFTKWLNELKDRIKNGDSTEFTATAEKQTDKEGHTTSSPDAETGAAATGELAKEAEEITGEVDSNTTKGVTGETPGGGVIKQFTESGPGGAALQATAVIGIACAAKGIAKAADDLKHDAVVLPLIRTGMMAMSVGNQVMSGKDMNAQQLSFFSKQLNDPKSGSWAAARSIQAEEGEKLTGPDIPESANIAKIQQGNMFTQLFDQIPGLDTVCSIADSAIGGFAMTVIGAVTAPVATIGQTILTQSGALDGVMSSLMRWIAGSPIPSFVVGPTYGNYINYGARLAANDSNASMGGIPLTNSQSTAIKQQELQEHQQEVASQPLSEKLFDPNSPDSLVGKAIDSNSGSITGNVASIIGNIMNPASILKGFGSIFTRSASADPTPYDYGFPEIGFSQDILNSPNYADPYLNAESVMGSLKSSGGKDLIKRASECFGVTLSTDGNIKSSFSSLDVTKKGFYTSSSNCADTSEEWTRIRLYILDTKTAEGADCYYTGDVQSCNDVGFGDTSSSSTAINGNVYVLGDSLTEGMANTGLADALQQKGWNPTINGQCGRHLVSDGFNCYGQAILGGMNQIDQPADQTAIKNAGVVVIGLGTNDPGSPTYGDDVTAMVSKVKSINPNAKIYWTNLFSTDEKEPLYQAMDATLSSLAGTDGFTVIDWATQATAVGAYAPGTYHPENYQALVDYVVNQLGQAP